MANYVLSQLAEQDVENIAIYTIEKFGSLQAEKYVTGLHQTLLILSEHPSMGSNQNHIKANTRRHVYRSHSIYYAIQNDTILIYRILGPGEDHLTQFNSTYENH